MQMSAETRVLKSGINQFKLLEFRVGKMKQGINLVKVKKLIGFQPEKIRPLVESPKAVLGAMEVDGRILSIIDLRKIYDVPIGPKTSEEAILITEFNNSLYGFVLDAINKVHRLSWGDLQKLSDVVPCDMVVAVATVPDGDVLMVDFEMIINNTFPNAMKMPPEGHPSEAEVVGRRREAKIIAADDSKIIRKKLDYVFKKHNFTNVAIFSDGLSAYEDLMQKHKEGTETFYTFMITDIEMPQMDGLTLCKKVKEKFPKLPVLILSSLVSDQLIIKCNEVGADDALSKDSMNDLVARIDALMLKQELEIKARQ